MLKFNHDEFLTRHASMAALEPTISEFVRAREFDNLFLIGSGGTYAPMLAYATEMHRTSTFPTRASIAPELVACGDRDLGAGSLCVFASVSGTTGDVLEAIDYCKAQGATTIGFTGYPDSPIARAVDHAFISEKEAWPFDTQLIYLTGALRHQRGEFDHYDDLVAQMRPMGAILTTVAEQGEALAAPFAEAHAEANDYFVVGAGNTWGFAYLYSMCILEEMQWLRTTRVHAAEFFHGSLELVVEGTPMLLMKGEDCSRGLVERVERFGREISGDVTVIDTAEYPLAGIDDEFRPLLSPLVCDTVCSRIGKHLERVRDHSLDLRRYYRKIEY